MAATEFYYQKKIADQESAINAVRELHKPVQGPYDNLVCDECSHMDIDIDFHTNHPCPTIEALDGKQS